MSKCCSTLLAGISLAGVTFMIGNGLAFKKKPKEKEIEIMLPPTEKPIISNENIKIKEPMKPEPVITEEIPVVDIINNYPITYAIRGIGYFVAGATVIAVPLYVINIIRRIHATVLNLSSSTRILGNDISEIHRLQNDINIIRDGEIMGLRKQFVEFDDLFLEASQKTLEELENIKETLLDPTQTDRIKELSNNVKKLEDNIEYMRKSGASYEDIVKAKNELAEMSEKTNQEIKEIKQDMPSSQDLQELKDKVDYLKKTNASTEDIKRANSELSRAFNKKLSQLRKGFDDTNMNINKILDKIMNPVAEEKMKPYSGGLYIEKQRVGGGMVAGFGMIRPSYEESNIFEQTEAPFEPFSGAAEQLRQLENNELANQVQRINNTSQNELLASGLINMRLTPDIALEAAVNMVDSYYDINYNLLTSMVRTQYAESRWSNIEYINVEAPVLRNYLAEDLLIFLKFLITKVVEENINDNDFKKILDKANETENIGELIKVYKELLLLMKKKRNIISGWQLRLIEKIELSGRIAMYFWREYYTGLNIDFENGFINMSNDRLAKLLIFIEKLLLYQKLPFPAFENITDESPTDARERIIARIKTFFKAYLKQLMPSREVALTLTNNKYIGYYLNDEGKWDA